MRGEAMRAVGKNKQTRLELVKHEIPVRTFPVLRTIDLFGSSLFGVGRFLECGSV